MTVLLFSEARAPKYYAYLYSFITQELLGSIIDCVMTPFDNSVYPTSL